MEGTRRRPFYGRMALSLLAFGWGPVFAITNTFSFTHASAEGFDSWLLGAGCLGALATAGFAARSGLQIDGQEVLDRGVFGEARVRYLRWREVEVSHLGPLRVIAPQLDNDQSGGWIVGRCARVQR